MVSRGSDGVSVCIAAVHGSLCLMGCYLRVPGEKTGSFSWRSRNFSCRGRERLVEESRCPCRTPLRSGPENTFFSCGNYGVALTDFVPVEAGGGRAGDEQIFLCPVVPAACQNLPHPHPVSRSGPEKYARSLLPEHGSLESAHLRFPIIIVCSACSANAAHARPKRLHARVFPSEDAVFSYRAPAPFGRHPRF